MNAAKLAVMKGASFLAYGNRKNRKLKWRSWRSNKMHASIRPLHPSLKKWTVQEISNESDLRYLSVDKKWRLDGDDVE